jgi:PKD repeat protein
MRIPFIIVIVLSFLPIDAHSQASFALVQNEVCIKEQLSIENTSVNAESYIWDFSFSELDTSGNSSFSHQVSGASRTDGIEIVHDKGEWIGLVTDRNTGILRRLEFGDDLSNVPAEIDLGIISSNAVTIRIFKENGNWYGLMPNYTNENLFRLSFGEDIKSTPSVETLGKLSGWKTIRGLDLIEHKDSIYAVVTAYSNDMVTIINFGTSITNTPVWHRDIQHSGVIDAPVGLGLFSDGDQMYGLISSHLNGKVVLVKFSEKIDSEVLFEINGISNSTDVEIVKNGTQVYGIALTSTSKMYRLNFGKNININELPSPEQFQIIGEPLQSNTWCFRKVRSTPDWEFLILQMTGNLKRIQFDDPVLPSTDFEPEGIIYNNAGTFAIELTAFSSNGNFDTYMDTVVVRDAIAPTTSFSTTNACIANPNTFTASSSDDPSITSWSWDFGDGTGTASGQNVNYQFLDTGEFEVNLSIETVNGCLNSTFNIIRIAPAPVSSFVTPKTNICSNAELIFTNTSNIINEEKSVFIWNFNSNQLDTIQDGIHKFMSDGIKKITLISHLTGCSDTLTQEITVSKGPFASFNWTNNCFEEPVLFINNSDTSNTEFTWEFGDGSSSNHSFSPSYIYPHADTFQVSLQVKDTVLGCLSTFTDAIITPSDSIVNYYSDNPIITNIPANVYGIDFTSIQDSIVNWEWFLQNYEDKFTNAFEYSFPIVDSIPFKLEVLTYQGCIDRVFDTIIVQPADKPTVHFFNQNEVCIKEQLSIENTSVNAESYIWDFSFSELDTSGNSSFSHQVSGASRTDGIEIVHDKGEWIGLVTDRNTGILRRLEFGDDLSNVPAEIDLGIISSNAVTIRIFKENGNWYGLMPNYTNENLFRLSFGEDIKSTPSVETLGKLSGWKTIRGLDLIEHKDSIYAVVTAYSNDMVTIINFGTSITNTPVWHRDIQHSGVIDAPVGLGLFSDGDQMYGLISSHLNGKVVLVKFSEKIDSEVLFEINGISNSTDVEIVKNGTQVYGIALTSTSKMYRLNFGKNININELPSPEQFQIIGEPLQSNTWCFRKVRSTPDWEFLILQMTGNLKRIQFDDPVLPSTDFEPEGIIYNNAGTFAIELTAFSSNGNFDTYMDTVVVRDAIAPTTSFSTTNACIANPNTFSASSSDDTSITAWSWDFGDGTGTASGQNVEYQFLDTGNFEVSLSIDAVNGCSNTFRQFLSIYNPPQAAFTYTSGITCSNSPLDFSNNTIFYGPDSVLTYQWKMDNEALLTETNPSYTFATGGDKNIILSASIPGCSSETSDLISITPGPLTSFGFDGSCQYDQFTFTNSTTGEDITDYQWDFGDGYSSSIISPNHRFESGGNYIVSLTASNVLGCSTTLQQVVPVHFIPTPNFTNDLACSDNSVTFYDQSTVSNANITEQYWKLTNNLLGYEQGATGPSPAFVPGQEGNYALELIAVSNYGCADTLVRDDVMVKPSPVANFTFENTCFGDSTIFTQFVDLPADTEISTIDWLIDGKLYSSNEVKYKFQDPGDYNVEMYVRASNFCTDNTSDFISILPLPEVDILLSSRCADQPVTVSPAVNSPLDPVMSFQWQINDKSVSNRESFVYQFSRPEDYEISVAVNTSNNCFVTAMNTFAIHPSPVSEFEIFPSIGASPLNVAFTDRSVGAPYITYDFSETNDDMSNEANTSYTYLDLGKDWPRQIAENEFGCTDTSFAEIEVVIPLYDIAITNVAIAVADQKLKMKVELANNGTIIINNPKVSFKAWHRGKKNQVVASAWR